MVVQENITVNSVTAADSVTSISAVSDLGTGNITEIPSNSDNAVDAEMIEPVTVDQIIVNLELNEQGIILCCSRNKFTYIVCVYRVLIEICTSGHGGSFAVEMCHLYHVSQRISAKQRSKRALYIST